MHDLDLISVVQTYILYMCIYAYALFFLGQETLCVLNINNNNIDDIRDLAVLKKLQHFSAAENKLNNIEVSIHLYT